MYHFFYTPCIPLLKANSQSNWLLTSHDERKPAERLVARLVGERVHNLVDGWHVEERSGEMRPVDRHSAGFVHGGRFRPRAVEETVVWFCRHGDVAGAVADDGWGLVSASSCFVGVKGTS